jgi:hypothetical protein
MISSLPKDTAFRLLGAVAGHFIMVVLFTWIACGNENPPSLHRRTMLDENVVSEKWESDVGESGGQRRVCYLYSKMDSACLWMDVKDHADDARRKGWQVEEVLFDDSGHCAHFLKYEIRYVEAVKNIWHGYGRKCTTKRVSKL